MNKGFTVYDNFWKAMECLPEEQQKEVSLAMIKYGIAGELPDAEASPIAYSLLTSWRLSIDKSADKINAAFNNGQYGGRPKKVTEVEIAELISRGMKAGEIAKALGVSINTIYKRDEWRNRGKNL